MQAVRRDERCVAGEVWARRLTEQPSDAPPRVLAVEVAVLAPRAIERLVVLVDVAAERCASASLAAGICTSSRRLWKVGLATSSRPRRLRLPPLRWKGVEGCGRLRLPPLRFRSGARLMSAALLLSVAPLLLSVAE